MTNQPPSDSLPSPLPPSGVAQSLEAEGKLPPTLDYAGPSTPTPVSLGHRTSVGILWLIVQTVGNRLVGIGSQIVLAWLLRPGDWGLVGMAYTVTSFAGVLVNPGLDQVLTHRQRRFQLWANPAFWMSAAFAIVAMMVLIAAAPIAARFYHQPKLVGLVDVMAVAAFFSAVAVVPTTALQVQMRFKLIAIMGMIGNFASALLSVLFAWRGFGAKSFVLPTLILNALILVFYWTMVRIPIRVNPQWRRWRFLVSDSLYVILTRVMYTIIGQGDYITLGYFYGPDVLGVYYFAFNLSTLVFRVLVGNITNVLFPAFSQVQRDLDRMYASAFRAATLLATFAVPAALLQIVLAHSAIPLFFHKRWWDAVLLVQLLSAGPILGVVAWPVGTMYQAMGRFKALFWLSVSFAVLFAALIVPLVRYDGARGAALTNLIYYVFSSFLGFAVIVRGRNPWWHALKLNATPLTAGAVATAAACLVYLPLAMIPRQRIALSAEFLAVPLVFLLVYIQVVRWLDRTLWLEIYGRIATVLASRKRSPQ